jgi:hypothetical protein
VPSDAASAEIVITRRRALFGENATWTVLIDDKKVGTLRVRESLTVHSAAGRHKIQILGGGTSEESLFDVTAGERTGIVCKHTISGPKIRRTDASQSTRPRVPTGNTVAETPTKSTVIEGSRYTVPLGAETRTMDNSKSGSPTMREVRLTREWTKTFVVDVEHITTMHGSADFSIRVLELKFEAERTLSKTYSTTTTERETFEEKVTVNVSPYTKSEIMFSWKEIRQKGVVQVVGPGFESQIPYEVVVGLTFDQQQTQISGDRLSTVS